MYLTVTGLYQEEWYENELETYSAEIDNGIIHSDNYEAELYFQKWKNEKILDYINKE